ncbi:MAG TPA: hypothetical protein PL048_11880 [Leptospiraceae bacterium]|nr:hypothetical protein [Leptospiraceae bacterium]HNF12487.1 hypothetical protein [Leptospiraceae bacterium]HNH08804.1 hypothetical protein [Leptospiraceae bacterium]HNI95464.1 hypothetical protein [Leptospiraceae bacterium]HNN04045.1 hypothetical protein [Leptospiraceae bacterium]
MKKIILSILIFSFISCAGFNRKNLLLATAVEENLVPEKPPMRYIAAPFYLPLGIAGGFLDVFLIHPLRSVPRAADDTIDALWRNREGGYITKMGAVPFLTVASPVFFAAVWMVRSFFDVGSSDYKPAEQSGSEEAFATAEKNFQENKKAELTESLYAVCYSGASYPDSFVRLLQNSYDRYKADANFSSTVISCMAQEKLYSKSEEFLFSKFEEEDNNQVFIMNTLASGKSKKRLSEAVLQKIFSKNSKKEYLQDYIMTLYRLENREHIQKFQNKLKD